MRISDWSSDVCSSDLCPSLQAKWNDRLFSRISAGSTALEKPYGPDRRRLARSRVEYDHYRHGRCAGACRPLDSDDHPFESCPPHRLRRRRHVAPETAPAQPLAAGGARPFVRPSGAWRSEEHTSELQSLMRISYAVFC